MGVLNAIETLSFFDVMVVADLVELKTLSDIGTGKLRRVDGEFRLVKNPADNYPPMFYQYRAELDLSDLLPGIVEPDDGVGAWIASEPVVLSNTNPVNPPPLRNIEWIATLGTPDRVVRYRSYNLSTPAVVGDWQPVREFIGVSGVPTFDPDYLGQLVIDTTSFERYVAVATSRGAGAANWNQL